jgi:protein SCO1/2
VKAPRALAAALAAAALLLAACDSLFAPKSPFKGVDVTGSAIGGELRLADHHGKERTLADFRGKVVVVSFGYTHCPDVCPTTLADLSAAVKRLGADAARVQVLFVTVDPKRDTRELLSQYVPAFNPDFLGLSGGAEATARVTHDFHVYAQERPGKSADTYTVDHSAQTFVFDREGRIRLVIAYGSAPADIASDLRILLQS